MGQYASATYLVAMVTSYHGNHSDKPITPLSLALLHPYLEQRFLGTIGISHILCCYGNYVTMATTVIVNNSFVLFCNESILGMEVPWDNRHRPHTSLL